mgnify:CR=1 FL=1
MVWFGLVWFGWVGLLAGRMATAYRFRRGVNDRPRGGFVRVQPSARFGFMLSVAGATSYRFCGLFMIGHGVVSYECSPLRDC